MGATRQDSAPISLSLADVQRETSVPTPTARKRETSEQKMEEGVVLCVTNGLVMITFHTPASLVVSEEAVSE